MSYLGLIEGSADALSSFIELAAGRLAADRGPRRVLVATGKDAMPALARAGIAAAMAPWQVLGSRLFDRAGKGIGSGPRDALIADWVVLSQRGRAFGLNRLMDDLGAALGPIIAFSSLALGASLRVTFAVAAAIGVIAPWLLFFRLRDSDQIVERSGPVDAPKGEGMLRPGFGTYLAACVFFALGNSSDAFLLVRARELGWSATALPPLWTFHHLVKAAAALPGGALSDRDSRALVVAAGWIAYALTYVGFGLGDRALAGAGPPAGVRPLPRPRGGGRTGHRRRSRRARRPRPCLRPVSRADGGAAALPACLGTGWIWDWWGATWALSIKNSGAAIAGIWLFTLSFAGPSRRQP